MSVAAFGFIITFVIGYVLCFFWEFMPSMEKEVWIVLILATALFSTYEALFSVE